MRRGHSAAERFATMDGHDALAARRACGQCAAPQSWPRPRPQRSLKPRSRPDRPLPRTASRGASLTTSPHAPLPALAVSLRNTKHSNGEAPGVQITAVRKRDAAHRAGLRAGDTLIWLNGLPCRTHAETVANIEKGKAHRVPISIVILPRGSDAPPLRPVAATPQPSGSASASAATTPANSTPGSPSASTSGIAAAAVAGGGAVTADSAAAAGSGGRGLRVCEAISWEELGGTTSPAADRVVVYRVALEDAARGRQWAVTHRYSKWRALHDTIQARWPSVLVEPTPLVFPRKTMVATGMAQLLMRAGLSSGLSSERHSFLDERAQLLEAFIRELLTRAAGDQISGLAEWLHHWLRHAEAVAEGEGGARATPSTAPTAAAAAAAPVAVAAAEAVEPEAAATSPAAAAVATAAPAAEAAAAPVAAAVGTLTVEQADEHE